MAELQATRWGPSAGPPARQLVVLCHGLAATGRDLIDLAPQFGPSLPHAAFAAPDAPEPYDRGPPGRQWWAIGDRDPARTAQGAAHARAALDQFIDAELARLGLPPDAYALLGFSQGAMMVLFAGLRRPVPPRAILAYSGALVAPDRLAERTNDAPILLVHGLADDVVPAFRSDDAAAALKLAGVPVELVFIPRVGHVIDPAGLQAGATMLQRCFAL